jgi:hypothetical protein
MDTTEIRIERPYQTYSSRLFPRDEIFGFIFLSAFLSWIVSKLAFHKGISTPEILLLLGFPAFYLYRYYRNTWIPAQYCITNIYSKDDYITITSNFHDDPPVLEKYYYKDISFKIDTRSNSRSLSLFTTQFVLIFKVAVPGQPDFKTKYMIRNQPGFNYSDALALFESLENWKHALVRAHPLN